MLPQWFAHCKSGIISAIDASSLMPCYHKSRVTTTESGIYEMLPLWAGPARWRLHRELRP